jgi:4-hydroxy-3-methylbut-2-enyl diphosphate reductase
VDFADEIDEAWLEGVTTVGVTSGASVPEILVEQVLEFLSRRGFEDVEIVKAAEESITFSLPKELRRDLREEAAALVAQRGGSAGSGEHSGE